MIHLNSKDILSLTKKQQIEWVRTCEETQRRQLQDTAAEILRRKNNLVALAGPTCSGKSTTAHRLITNFTRAGKKVKVISTDDYFKHAKDYPKTDDGVPDFDHFDCMDSQLLRNILHDLAGGKTVELSRFDFVTGIRTDGVETFRITEDHIVILEGIHAHNPVFFDNSIPHFKLGLNITQNFTLDADKLFDARELRLIRRIIRDEKKRNYSAAQTINIWKNVARGEEHFILPYMKHADKILTTELDYEPMVWRDDALNSLRAIESNSPHYEIAAALAKRAAKLPFLPLDLVPEDSILQEFLGLNQH